jgi:hypothetical protein
LTAVDVENVDAVAGDTGGRRPSASNFLSHILVLSFLVSFRQKAKCMELRILIIQNPETKVDPNKNKKRCICTKDNPTKL